MAVEDTIRELVPDFSGSDIGGLMGTLGIFVLLLAIVGFGGWWLVNWSKYNKKVVIFDKVGSEYVPVKKDKGMFLRIGSVGDEVFHIRKVNKYRPSPGFQTGKNTFWFFRGEDGELINFKPGDFDAVRKEMGIKIMPTELAYARLSLEDQFKKRFDKVGFMEKYGQLIVNFGAIAFIMIFLWLIVGQLIEITSSVTSTLVSASEVQQSTRDILVALDNVCSTSGII